MKVAVLTGVLNTPVFITSLSMHEALHITDGSTFPDVCCPGNRDNPVKNSVNLSWSGPAKQMDYQILIKTLPLKTEKKELPITYS